MQRLFAGQLPGWPLPDVLSWLLTEGRQIEPASKMIGELCERLVKAGAPLIRVRISLLTLHPQVRDFSFTWYPGRSVNFRRVQHGIEDSASYVGSPWAYVFSSGQPLRRRLDGIDGERDHVALHEVKDLGGTDYYALPLRFGPRTIGVSGFVVDDPKGLSDADLAKLDVLIAVLTPILQVTALQGIAKTLLDTYVGHRTGERVLKGQIRRGDTEPIEAAICFSDLRDFTALSEARPPDEIVETLNTYFEYLAAATQAHGGEVLKFIGDAVLTIFPTSAHGSIEAACESGLNAALDTFANIETVNIQRQHRDLAPISFGIALHQGTVIYGNVGAPERLDFTVLGSAVNRTARLETLSKTLRHSLVMSAEFAECVSRSVRSLGHHKLAGIEVPQEAFTLSNQG
jgi:adenylate cyclase